MTATVATGRACLPNFFILGAGRCGTTSLARALNSHPDVYIPSIKEPSFFSSSFRWVKDPAKYVSLYDSAGPASALGDASHIYLEDPGCPRVLKAFFPDARFVLVFRNPADRALGLYSHMVSGGYEVLPTFERALDAEDRRFASSRFRKTCRQSFWNYMYVRSGLFGEQVQRYLEHFPRDQFWFTTLGQLIAVPNETMQDLHRFLGVDPAAIDAFPRDGTSKGVRSRIVAYAEPRLIRPVARRVGPSRRDIPAAVARWNQSERKPAMQPATRRCLQDRFEDDLLLLRTLTGIDLTAGERPS